jgi:hypothetical protein
MGVEVGHRMDKGASKSGGKGAAPPEVMPGLEAYRPAREHLSPATYEPAHFGC